MSNWGISPNASEKEKIKADYADILHGMNSTGAITYDVYSDLFDDGMELFDRMYEQGKADAADVVEVVHGRWTVLDECANAGAYCSVCHKKVYKECYGNCKMRSAYCPNCGAKMDGGAENE